MNVTKYIGTEKLTVVELMQKIDNNGKGILFIVDESGALAGSLTDGDIRRWLIKTGDLNGTAYMIMNRETKYLTVGDSEKAQSFMRNNKVKSIPIVDANRMPTEIAFIGNDDDNITVGDALRGIPVIIMAGGKGTRLYPYTKILPKPLIPIGDIPILERILNRFYSYGVVDFYITVNYKKEMIKSYFKELNPPYNIHYVEESKPLGTAGGIKLIKDKFSTPVIITNCDILIEADYEKVYNFHKEYNNDLTIVSSLKNVVIPYGVLEAKEHGRIVSMEEKPHLSYFINTGMYIVDPEYLCEIPDDTFFHMTDLADNLMKEGCKVCMYPISENSYLDMGQFEEMKNMEDRINSGEIE